MTTVKMKVKISKYMIVDKENCCHQLIVDIKVLPAVGDFVRWFAVINDCLGHLSVITG